MPDFYNVKIYRVIYMNYRSTVSYCLVTAAIVFNLLLVLFLVSSFSTTEYSISPPNIPDSTYLSPNTIDSWFNSDALTQYHFFTGIERGDSLKDWKISTVSHYFPTIALFGTGYYLFHNPGISMLFYVAMQLLIILLLFSWLVKQLVQEYVTEARLIGLLFVSLFILYALFVPDVDMTSNFLLPYHTGMFLNMLLASVFLMKYLKKQQWLYLLLMSVTVSLATLSNSLFHVYFTAPALVVVGACALNDKKRYLPALIAIVLSVVAGLILKKIFPQLAIQLALHPTHYDSFAMLADSVRYAFNSSLLVASIFILFFVSYMYSVVRSIQTIRHIAKASVSDLTNYELYHLFYVVLVMSSLLGPIVAGNYVGIWCIRYIIYSFILGLFNVGIILAYHCTLKTAIYFKSFAYIMLLSSVAFAGMRALHQNPFGAFNRLTSYNCSDAQAVDSLSMRFHLKNGVSVFWHAKTISVFSKQKVKVVFAIDNLKIWKHSFHIPDFKQDSVGKPAYYNFIVLRGRSDTTSLRKIFGDSIVRVNQNGYSFYLVPEFTYNDNYDFQLTGKFDFSEELRKQKLQDSVNQLK